MSTVATISPKKAFWTEEEYLALPGGQMVEFDQGRIEVLPMPSLLHQKAARRLQRALEDFVEPRNLGVVVDAPFPVKVGPRKYREPDLIYRRSGGPNLDERKTSHFDNDRVELVVEVLSDGATNRKRDLITKRREYAEAGILEYWIIDLDANDITVLNLKDGDYQESGRYQLGDMAKSNVLPSFAISVQYVIAPQRGAVK